MRVTVFADPGGTLDADLESARTSCLHRSYSNAMIQSFAIPGEAV